MEDPHAELLRDHAVINVLARKVESLLDRQADPRSLSQALNHLVEAVAGHLEVEEAVMYSEALTTRGDVGPDAVQRMEAEFARLKSDWGHYVRCWTPDEVAADRQGFTQATRQMLPRLRDRVRLETELLALARPSHRGGGM